MAGEKKNGSDESAPKGEENVAASDSAQAPGLPVIIHTQYLKDLSFENPNAPESLRQGQGAPQIEMNISMDARKIEDGEMEHLYEVILKVNANAERQDKAAFIAEIVYGAVVSLNERSETRAHTLLLMEVPRMMYPFARQILAEITGSGGFPPLLLGAVDFRAMYMNQFGKTPDWGDKDYEPQKTAKN